MRCLFFMCSESTAIDAPTGRLNIFHVLEELTATSFPVMVSQLHMVAMLEKSAQEPGQFVATAAVTLDGAPVGNEMTLAIDFKGQERTKVVANIQGVVLPKPGKVRVLLKTQNSVLGVWEMHLRFMQQQRQDPPAPVTAPPASAAASTDAPSPEAGSSDPQLGEKLRRLQRAGKKGE